jgi:O-antigen biosynthesis protein WbqV
MTTSTEVVRMSQIEQPLRTASLGFHAVPLYAAIALGRLLSGPDCMRDLPALRRGEVYAYLRRRLVGRFKAVTKSKALFFDDLSMSALAVLLATMVRLGLDGQVAGPESFRFLLFTVPGFVLTCAAIFPLSPLYSRNWRHASVADLFGIVRVVCVASLVFVFCIFVARLFSVPRSVMVIEALILAPLMIALRLRPQYRAMLHLAAPLLTTPEEPEDKLPVLLIGTGDAADLYLCALQRDPTARYWPVGILDNGTAPEGFYLRGVPVLGSIGDFEAVVRDLSYKGLRPRHLILTEGTSGFAESGLEELINCADRTGMAISRPAPVLELRNPKSESRFELRPIELTDLLERPQAALDRDALRRMIACRRVLVTGAGGSIGSELILQLAAFGPSELVAIDHCEYNIYAIDLELGEKFPNLARKVYLCDVRDAARLMEIFDRHRPELVFHAAALKHVPMVELNPCEGVLTNVLGTMNVADATRRCGAQAMVQISTDKAVNATSVMGATKRLAELYCQALDLESASAASPVRFMTVRFGNVLGSSGSLIPLFKRQLARGGPLTVTHPEMTRFFMTIREAVELTLQASAYGLEKQVGQGEIFVLDMGEPIKIIDMARRMIKLAGYVPEEDIKIDIVGCRPGEKLFEELFDDNERRVNSPVPGVLGAIPHPVPLTRLQRAFAQLRRRAKSGDLDGLVDLITQILPTYRKQTAKPPALLMPTTARRRSSSGAKARGYQAAA